MLSLIPKILQNAVETLKGDRLFSNAKRSVTVFGSARISNGNQYYESVISLGKALAENNLVVRTGSGPGLMEAISMGAKKGKGTVLGANISIPFEQSPNPYNDKTATFHSLSIRRTAMIEGSNAFIAVPGGIGTLDEIFEVLSCMQTDQIPKAPVIFFGALYWKDLWKWIDEVMIKNQALTREEVKDVLITDSAEETIKKILSR